jgi:hypothetical protein
VIAVVLLVVLLVVAAFAFSEGRWGQPALAPALARCLNFGIERAWAVALSGYVPLGVVYARIAIISRPT